MKTLDANDDGAIELVDGVLVFKAVLFSAHPLVAPFPDCGTDPTEDELACDEYTPCAP